MGSVPSGRLKNLKDVNKWSSLTLYLSIRGMPVIFELGMSDGLNSPLSLVVYEDI